MGTVFKFKLLGIIGGEPKCPVSVHIERECNDGFLNYAALLTDEELQQLKEEWEKEHEGMP